MNKNYIKPSDPIEDELKFDMKAFREGSKTNTNTSKHGDKSSYNSFEGYNIGLGDFDYDKNFTSRSYKDEFTPTFKQQLDAHRAENQGWANQTGSALFRLTNAIPETIGTISSALDFEDYMNTDGEVSNWLTNLTNQWKEATNEAAPIFRKNPGKALDWGDVGWWAENGSSLVQSALGFAVGGGVLTKGLTGLSKVAKINKIANAIVKNTNIASKINTGAQTGLTSLMLNQAEGVMEATDVFEETYNFQVNKLRQERESINFNASDGDIPTVMSDEDINKIATERAADAASSTINANRWTIALNITSANKFLQAPTLTARLLEKETLKRSLKEGVGESVQEAGEELVNLVAGKYGRARGKASEEELEKGGYYTFENIVDDITTAEAAETALLGAIGGIGQTILTTEGVNRLRSTIDPETGERISVRKYNNNMYEKQKEKLNTYKQAIEGSDIRDFTTQLSSVADKIRINDAIDKATLEGNDDEVKRLKKLTLGIQAFEAFQDGTTDVLVKTYEELGAGPQKEGMDSDYKAKAKDAINKIRSLEKEYHKASKYKNHKAVFINRAINKDLNDIFDNYTNDIVEQESSINDYIQKVLTANNVQFPLDINNIDDIGNISTDKYTSKGQSTLNFDNKASKSNTSFTDNTPAKDKAIINEIIDTVKNHEAIQVLNALKDNRSNILSKIKNNEKEYSKITSEKYQDNYHQELENSRKKAEKKLNEESEQVDKEVKAEDNKRKRDQADKVIDQQVTDLNTKADRAKDADANSTNNVNTTVENIANNYRPGQIVDPQNLIDNNIIDDSKINDTIKIKSISEDGKTVTIEFEDDTTSDIKHEDIVIDKSVKDDYSTDGPIVNPTSNEDATKTEDENIDKGKRPSSKLMSTYSKDHSLIPNVPSEFLDFERSPLNKVGTPITFSINLDYKTYDIPVKTKINIGKSLILLEKLQSGEDLDANEIDFIIDNLPIKAHIDGSKDKFTFINRKPSTTNKKSLEAYSNTSRVLRESIVYALKQGNTIESISTTIVDQYGGQLQLDGVASNNVSELNEFNGDNSKVNLFLVDKAGELLDTNGNKAEGWYHQHENWRGAIYTKITKANGKPFYLKLDNAKVTESQAEGIYEIYKSLISNENMSNIKSTIQDLPPSTQKVIIQTLAPEIKLLTTINKSKGGDVKVSELLDLLFWDGSRNPKSRLKLIEGRQVMFGEDPKPYESVDFELEDTKAEFIDWVSKNKNRNIKFRPKEGSKLNLNNKDYKDYVLNNNILTTNAKVNEPTFAGFTNMSVNNGVNIEKTSNIPLKSEEKIVSLQDKKEDLKVPARQPRVRKPAVKKKVNPNSKIARMKKAGNKGENPINKKC